MKPWAGTKYPLLPAVQEARGREGESTCNTENSTPETQRLVAKFKIHPRDVGLKQSTFGFSVRTSRHMTAASITDVDSRIQFVESLRLHGCEANT